MFLVNDIYDEGKKILGACDDVKFFRWVGDAVSLIANKGEFEGWKGWLDICTSGGRCVTLPREVETVLAVNIGGTPSIGFDQLFNFHLNGPGDCTASCTYAWQDQGNWHSTYRDLVTPSYLVAYVAHPSDNNKQLIVFGYDSNGSRLRRQEAGVWKDGYLVPTVYGVALPDVDAPLVARITGIQKEETNYPIRLSTIDNTGLTGTLLAIYEPDETLPQYRRIRLSASSSWVRIAYRRTTPIFKSKYDHVPLRSRIALLNALRACKFYHETALGEAHAYEADAARLEFEAQQVSEPPVFAPIQVVDMSNPKDKSDYDIR